MDRSPAIPWAGSPGICRTGDFPVFVGIDGAYEEAHRRQVPALIEGRFLVVQAARTERPAERPEPVTGPVVTGRSLRAQSRLTFSEDPTPTTTERFPCEQ